MLLVITCAVASAPGRRRWPVIGALLGLIALTSAFGAVVAVAVLAGLGTDELLRRRQRTGSDSTSRALVTGAGLAFLGLALAYLQAGRTPADTGSYNHWRTSLDPGLGASSASAIWRALVPIPALRHSYWNTNIISARAAVVGVLGLILFVVVAWLFRDLPGSFVIWVGGVTLVVGFLYARIGTATASRHIGHIFLCLFAAMWLAPTMQSSGSRARSDRHGASRRFPGFTLTRSNAWTALLMIQVVAGIFAVSLDLAYPFSNGRDVAEYITRHHLDGLEIVGMPDTATSTVAGYLDQPIYYLAGARSGTFVVWNTARTPPQPIEDVVASIDTTKPPLLVLLNRPLNDPNLRLRLLTHFDNGIVPDEHFWLYLGSAKTAP
jgi:hypothetical protein